MAISKLNSKFDSKYFADSRKGNTKQSINYCNTSSLFEGRNVRVQNRNDEVGVINQLVKCGDKTGGQGDVTADFDGDGKMDTQNIINTIVDSCDSKLDLVIDYALRETIQHFGTACLAGILSDEGQKYLKDNYGIVVNRVGDKWDRIYSFSIVDDEGKVLQDEEGGLATKVFADNLTADGNLGPLERNLASVLDNMGYDCVSDADFVGKEGDYEEFMTEILQELKDGDYKGSRSVDSIYANSREVKTRATVYKDGSTSRYDQNAPIYSGGDSSSSDFAEFGDSSKLIDGYSNYSGIFGNEKDTDATGKEETDTKEQKAKTLKYAIEFYKQEIAEAKSEEKNNGGSISDDDQSSIMSELINQYGREIADQVASEYAIK